MEVIRIADNTEISEAQQVRLSVNVDRIEQLAANVADNKDALHIRGFQPHHFGMRKTNQSTSGIRALKGKLSIKIPSTTNSDYTQLTPMRTMFLKRQKLDQLESGASFWIGLTKTNASGGLEQWVQTGVRWVQPVNETIASPPALYLETGDTYLNLKASGKTQETTNAGNYGWLGQGVTKNADAILANWNTQVLQLDFILYKAIISTTNGVDNNPEPWKVIFKDANGNYLMMQRSNSPPSGSVGTQNQQELINRYCSQSFLDIDCMFEANNSISFTVGTSDSKSSFSELQYSTNYIPQSAPEPGTSNKAALFAWAESNFSWENTTFPNFSAEVKTGRWSFNAQGALIGAQNGTHDHPYWNKSNTAASLKIWDLRNYGFGAAP